MRIAEHHKNSKRDIYTPQQAWEENDYVQWGSSGVVLAAPPYQTAFFEAFPQNPKTFIRGEGKTIEEAELSAFKKYQSYKACPQDHANPDNFDRKGYENGLAFCKACNYSTSDLLEPTTECHVCKAKTYWTQDKNNQWWCETCAKTMPKELKSISEWDELFPEETKNDSGN